MWPGQSRPVCYLRAWHAWFARPRSHFRRWFQYIYICVHAQADRRAQECCAKGGLRMLPRCPSRRLHFPQSRQQFTHARNSTLHPTLHPSCSRHSKFKKHSKITCDTSCQSDALVRVGCLACMPRHNTSAVLRLRWQRGSTCTAVMARRAIPTHIAAMHAIMPVHMHYGALITFCCALDHRCTVSHAYAHASHPAAAVCRQPHPQPQPQPQRGSSSIHETHRIKHALVH